LEETRCCWRKTRGNIYCNEVEVEAESVSSHREFSDWAQGANPTGDIYIDGKNCGADKERGRTVNSRSTGRERNGIRNRRFRIQVSTFNRVSQLPVLLLGTISYFQFTACLRLLLE
jgi:hypothetical protein